VAGKSERRKRAREAAKAIKARSPGGSRNREKQLDGAATHYRQVARGARPPRPLGRNVARAFLVGGLICAIGQGALAFWSGRGFPKEQAIALTAGTMVAIAALLTGLGVYDAIGQFGGMGSALPITGFSNSIVSPALEYKREGYILGVGARMFTVAGPVIVYGLLSAVVVALFRILAGAGP
jgi:stage V sporulation protein AC